MKRSLKLICSFGAALAVVGVALWRYSHHGTAASSTSPVAQASLPVQTGFSVGASAKISGRPATPGAPEEKQQQPVPERLRLALSGSVRFSERVLAVRGLKSPLTDAERDAVYRYLRTPANNPHDRDRENWLRNEMMDKLVQQADAPPGLADLLIAVYQDTTQDVVMRDYAVQHMAAIFGQVSPDEQTNLGNALWLATGETDSSIAGTALLALLAVSGTNPTIDTGRLADTAVNLADNDQTGELSRITAVQVCGRLGAQQALPVIEQLTQQSPSMPLRIAATAALGDYAMTGAGTASTEADNLLTQLAQSADPRQALAAESALGRIARAQATLAKQTGP